MKTRKGRTTCAFLGYRKKQKEKKLARFRVRQKEPELTMPRKTMNKRGGLVTIDTQGEPRPTSKAKPHQEGGGINGEVPN